MIECKGVMPQRMSDEAAGYDLITTHDYFIEPDQTVLVKTGTSLSIPAPLFGMLVPRSSIVKRGLILQNSVGVIDPDYRGELMFAYRNITDEMVKLSVGERIGQIVLMQAAVPMMGVDLYTKVEDFTTTTERGEGSFGSTGE